MATEKAIGIRMRRYVFYKAEELRKKLSEENGIPAVMNLQSWFSYVTTLGMEGTEK